MTILGQKVFDDIVPEADWNAILDKIQNGTDFDIKPGGIRVPSPASGSGTDADPWPGAAIQAAFDDLPLTGGMVFIPAGTWDITTTPVLNKPFTTIRGAGNATKLTTTSDVPLLRLGDGLDRYWRVTLEKVFLEQKSPADTPALRVSGLSQSLLHDIRVFTDAEGARHTAILWDTAGDNMSLNNMISHAVLGFTFVGIDLVGLATAKLNDMKIYGTTVNGLNKPVGSVGLRHDHGDSLRVYGLGIETWDVGLDLGNYSQLCEFYGLRLEELNLGIRLFGFNAARNHFFGGSQFGVLTFLEDNSAYQLRFKDFDRFTTRRNNTATIANGTSSIVVTHGCDAVPFRVFLTGTHSEVRDCWVTAVGASTFTINAPANVTANRSVYWDAVTIYDSNT